MKKQAINTLIKDIILAVVASAISTILVHALFSGQGFTVGHSMVIASIFFAGFPFGWRWASKIITAISWYGIFIKLSLSIFLGFIAIWVVLIGDIIRCFIASSKEPKRIRRPREINE